MTTAEQAPTDQMVDRATSETTQQIRPNGLLRKVNLDDVFFSATDQRGAITAASAVFDQLAAWPISQPEDRPRYPPHHPDMPGAVMRQLWQHIALGRPFAGYIRNLARDGLTYWTFTTVKPVTGGYLSIHTAPCDGAVFKLAEEIYERLVPLEETCWLDGLSREEAAAEGQRALEEVLKAIGFAGYGDFMARALPSETTARLARLSYSAGVTQVGGNALAPAMALARQLDQLLGRLSSLQDLTGELIGGARQLTSTTTALHGLTARAAQASDLAEPRAPILTAASRAMTSLENSLAATAGALPAHLASVHQAVGELRFGIALAHRHTVAVLAFIDELRQGFVLPAAAASIPVLFTALTDSVRSLSGQALQASATLGGLAQEIAVCGRRLAQLEKLLASWRLAVPRYGLSTTLEAIVEPIDQHLAQGLDQAQRLRQLSDACSRQAAAISCQAFASPVTGLVEEISHYQVGLNPPA